MMAEKTRSATVLAVTSGKGGVGKSNISANLAICLAASGRKIALLDADLGLANLDVLMNISSRYTIANLISGNKSIEEIIQIGPAGVEIICGVSGVESFAELTQFQRQRVLNELDKVVSNYDAVILDTPAGIGKTTLGFCTASDNVLVVTTPEPTAMTDAYAMIKVLTAGGYKNRISVVVNMAETLKEGRDVYRQISQVARTFLGVDVYDAGVILKDEKLVSSVKARRPVVLEHPDSQISNSIAALAARLCKGCTVKTEQEGFFRKVVNWFF